MVLVNKHLINGSTQLVTIDTGVLIISKRNPTKNLVGFFYYVVVSKIKKGFDFEAFTINNILL
jgi:hypothetical protein